MIPISPINAQTVSPFIGSPVCAVLQDGTRHFGILRGIGGGQLYLDGCSGGGPTLASLPGSRKARVKGGKSHTNAFGFGFGFGFAALALSLAVLAALFFIPFFI